MSEISNMNFTDSCRTCAIKTKNLQNLYQVNEHGQTLAQKIKQCLSLSFYEFELRPKYMCTKCVSKLNAVYEFHERIKSSDEIFKKIVASEFITKSETNTADDEVKDLKPLILINTKSDTKSRPIVVKEQNTKRENIDVDESHSDVDQFHNEPHPSEDDINSDLERRWQQKFGIQSIQRVRRKVRKNPVAAKRPRPLNNFGDKFKSAEFQCFDCKASFSSKGKLQAHMREFHQTTTVCRICMKNFTRHEYVQHLCDGGTEMQCQYCIKKFNSTAMLVKHINQLHKKHHSYKCYDCARAFPTKALLEIHKPIHDTETLRFVCDICGNRYRTRYQIKEHIETTHTDKRSFLCATCGKNFNNVTNWRLHVSRHTPTKPVACPKCPKRFFDKHGLKKHEEVHEEKTFICDICGSIMRSKASYSEHMRRHKKAKVFTCEVCSKQIKSSSYNFKLHMFTHSGEKPFKCTYCERRYTQSADLNKHLRTHVGINTYKCDIDSCEKSFRLLRELRKHISEHYQQNLASNETVTAQ